jgi:hypothetical protein
MSRFEVGHQFKAREARDHLRAVLDAAERGETVVLRRDEPLVLLRRDVLDADLAERYPIEPQVSFREGGVAVWIDGMPVHAEAATYDEAEDAFLDALVDYAELWVDELRHAPNHRHHAGRVRRVAMYAGDRSELRRAVFGE